MVTVPCPDTKTDTPEPVTTPTPVPGPTCLGTLGVFRVPCPHTPVSLPDPTPSGRWDRTLLDPSLVVTGTHFTRVSGEGGLDYPGTQILLTTHLGTGSEGVGRRGPHRPLVLQNRYWVDIEPFPGAGRRDGDRGVSGDRVGLGTSRRLMCRYFVFRDC